MEVSPLFTTAASVPATVLAYRLVFVMPEASISTVVAVRVSPLPVEVVIATLTK